MGKYMRKSKMAGDVAVMEVISQSSFGVRTRAKTLALQRLESALPPPPPPPNPESSASYLQLRSRRLQKVVPSFADPKRQQSKLNPNPNPNRIDATAPGSRANSSLRVGSVNSASVGSVSISCSKNEFMIRARDEDETEDYNDLGIQASFGENNLVDFEGRERSTRESTPCSLIRESVSHGTPGSTTRRTATNRRTLNAMQRSIPTTHEMEEFFACAEQQQQRLFTEKYNFDVVNDLPLPGRYEWVRVNH